MMITVNNTNGDHALKICTAEYSVSRCIVGAGSLGKRQVFLGFQNFKKMIKEIIEPIPAITSGRAGPKKLEENHCMKAKETPETNIAGNTSIVFL
jgi:hypothetical protein